MPARMLWAWVMTFLRSWSVFSSPGCREKEVEIVLTDKAFALYDEDAHFMLEAGDYEVSVGMQQPDRRSSELTGQTCSVLKVHCSETKEL